MKNPMLQGKNDNGGMYLGHRMISTHVTLIFNEPQAFIGCKEFDIVIISLSLVAPDKYHHYFIFMHVHHT